MNKLNALEKLKAKYEEQKNNLEKEIETSTNNYYIALCEDEILASLVSKDNYYKNRKAEVSETIKKLDIQIDSLNDEKGKIETIIARIDFQIRYTDETVS